MLLLLGKDPAFLPFLPTGGILAFVDPCTMDRSIRYEPSLCMFSNMFADGFRRTDEIVVRERSTLSQRWIGWDGW